MYPDLSTFKVLPWSKGTSSILVDSIFHDSSESTIEISSRSICKRLLVEIEKLEMKIFGAFEYEFYVMDAKTRLPAFPDISVIHHFHIRNVTKL